MTQLNDGSSENSTRSSDDRDKTMAQVSEVCSDSHWDTVSAKQLIETDIALCRRLLEEVSLLIDGQGSGRRFDSIEFIGYGAFGVVHKARDIQLDRDVAVKMLRPSKSESRNLRRRFLREARAAASLEHAGIARVLDVGRCGEIPFIVSAFVPGIDLARWFEGHDRKLLPRQAAMIVKEVADAVHFAHNRGVLHRDIKPGNILLRELEVGSQGELPWKPALTDFGLAKRIDEDTSGENDLTVDGAIQGTVRYMSPEQAMGHNQDIGIPSDIFSLGVILFELLVGHVPFQGESEESIRIQIATQSPSRPRRMVPQIPKDLEAITMKCLEKEPEARYSSAKELSEDLLRFLNRCPVRARSLGVPQRIGYWMKRNPRQAVLGGLAMGVLSSAIAIAGIAKWRESIESTRANNNWHQMLLATNNIYENIAEKLFGGSPISDQEHLSILLQSLELHRQYAIQSGHDEHSRHRLSVAHHYASVGYERMKNYGEALRQREACMRILEGLISEHPDSERYRYDHFHNLFLVGYIRGKAGQPCDTTALLWQSKFELDELLKVAPENPVYLDALATLHVKLASELLSIQDDEWRSHSLLSRDVSRRLWEAHPDNPIYSKGAILSWGLLALDAMNTGQLEVALDHCQQGKEFYEKSLRPFEEELWVFECSRLLFLTHCQVLFAMERWDEYLTLCDEIGARHNRLMTRLGYDVSLDAETLQIKVMKGIALQQTGKQQSADLCFHEAGLEIDALSDYPQMEGYKSSLEKKYQVLLGSRSTMNQAEVAPQ